MTANKRRSSRGSDSAPSSVRSTRSRTSAAAGGASPIPLDSPEPQGDGDGYEWGQEPVEKLTGSKLEWSTIEEKDGKRKLRTAKKCWLCGHLYAGGPDAIRIHFDIDIKPRKVQVCKPKSLHRARHKLILAEMKRRTEAENKKKKAAAKNAGLREEGRAVAAGLSAEQARAAEVFKLKSPDEVTNAWLEVCVKNAIPLSFFDDQSVRNAMSITAKCGSRLSVGGQVQVPKRKKITEKILPKFDQDLDAKIRGRMQGVLPTTGATIISDGWSSCANRPVINALAASPTGTYFIKAVDTSGETKDATFIANFIIDVIKEFGPDKVTAVCMDGACLSSFAAIEEEYRHVHCFICPTHSLDNFMKNVCSGEKETINVRGYTGPTLAWGEELFSDSFTQVWEVVKWITNHHKPLAIYREIAKREKKDGPTELVKYAETRFASKIMMITRYYEVHVLLEKLLVDNAYTTWVAKQKTTEAKAKALEIKKIIHDGKLLETIDLCIDLLSPCMQVLRLTDGKKGATLSNVYAKMLALDLYYREPIDGLNERVRKKIHAIFMARWTYFHTPVMTAAYRLAPEYCRREMCESEDKEIKKVFKKMATDEHPYPSILADYAAYEVALDTKTHDLDKDTAFSPSAQKMPPYQWARMYLRSWPHLKYVACRLLALSCSASGCEHSWSIEAWIHSKTRNRLGQKTVDRLVRCHTNLLLQQRMDSEEAAAVLEWEEEMEIEDPEVEGEEGEEGEEQ